MTSCRPLTSRLLVIDPWGFLARHAKSLKSDTTSKPFLFFDPALLGWMYRLQPSHVHMASTASMSFARNDTAMASVGLLWKKRLVWLAVEVRRSLLG